MTYCNYKNQMPIQSICQDLNAVNDVPRVIHGVYYTPYAIDPHKYCRYHSLWNSVDYTAIFIQY